ncbi:MAG: hypothetical protein KUG82_13055 [Pseudomonadales bacterium]|nr:hypothetical protein [Pseudomonadales bacterium]
MSGCAVKFIYNQLDWVIPWQIRDYISLNDSQKDYLDHRLTHHLAWHRRTQLPDYALFLRKTAKQISDGLTRDELVHINSQLEIFGRTLTKQIAPDVAQLFLTSSDTQLTNTYRKFEQTNAKFQKEYIDISEEKLRKKRLKETQHYLERWLGGLTREQQDALKDWSQKFKPIRQNLMENRLSWQKDFRSLMAKKSEHSPATKEIVDLFSRPDKNWNSEYNEKIIYNKNLLVTLFQKIDTLLTKRQRKKLNKKLTSLARDLEELAVHP